MSTNNASTRLGALSLAALITLVTIGGLDHMADPQRAEALLARVNGVTAEHVVVVPPSDTRG